MTCSTCLGRGYTIGPPDASGYPVVARCTMPHNGCLCTGADDMFYVDADGRDKLCPVCTRFDGRIKIVRQAFRQADLPPTYRAARVESLAGDRRRDIASRLTGDILRVFAIPPETRPTIPGAIFLGPPGTGKTETACAIAVDLMIARGRGAWFVSVEDLFSRLRSNMDAPPELKRPESEFTARLASSPVLVLDDLAKVSDWQERILYNAVNARWIRRAELVTLITSNATEKSLAQIAGGRLYSRLADMCAVITISGPDHRLERAVGRATVGA